ncbi:hypothetical protein K4F52_008814 [Lecanicillium sp. MT-2017a]|nr:hypothetical protein K4F52_008814 [Lecanicillium sp. MT-2017a]
MSPMATVFMLSGNGLLAVMLNISWFNTNKVAGALTMAGVSNLKQCLIVSLGRFIFDVAVELPNSTGMLITMFGAAIYSKAELDNCNKK